MNVVISGIVEDKSTCVFRDVLSKVLYTATGKDIVIDDAFHLGRYTAGKTRLARRLSQAGLQNRATSDQVKLHSSWDRRLVLGDARKLNEVDEFKRRFYIAADEPLEVR